jgi:hypothetical protein
LSSFFFDFPVLGFIYNIGSIDLALIDQPKNLKIKKIENKKRQDKTRQQDNNTIKLTLNLTELDLPLRYPLPLPYPLPLSSFFLFLISLRARQDKTIQFGCQHLHDVAAQFYHCFLHAMPTTTCVGMALKKPG